MIDSSLVLVFKFTRSKRNPLDTLSTENVSWFDGNTLDHAPLPELSKDDILFTSVTLSKNYTYRNTKEKCLLQMIFNTTMELHKPNNKLLMFLHSTSRNANLKS